MDTERGADRMLDWAMASTRMHLSRKRLAQLRLERDRLRFSASWSTTSMGSQPIVQDNESTDPHPST
jgi:hypothetical protein